MGKPSAGSSQRPDGPIPVVVMGLGIIGQEIARAALKSPEVELVGAIDKAPALLGKKLSDVLGHAAGTLKVSRDLAQAAGTRRGVVVLHATSSRLPLVMDQLLEACAFGASVVSTCEELSFPHLKHPDLADKLDRAAQKAGVSILGTGVNPGFVLDRLVATVSQVMGPVHRIKATRVVDVRTRRPALQRKVGAGLSEAEFLKLVDEEQLGHVGLVESAALAALGVGLDCDDFEEEILPVIADEDISGGAFAVKKGRVAGIFQSAVGLSDGQEKVRLELTIAMGAEPVGDHVHLEGEEVLDVRVVGGVAGDRATANLVVNAAPRVAQSQPGLLTVLDLPAGR